MAGNTPTQLPAYIQMRYEESGVFDRMATDAGNAGAAMNRALGGSLTTIQKDASNTARVTRTELSQAFRGIADDADREFSSAYDRLNKYISSALTMPRNAAGSLDLGVAELQRAATAQEARAIAAQEAAAAVRRAASAEGDYSQTARQTIAAAEALAVKEREAAAAARDHAAAMDQIQRELNQTASGTRLVIGANDNGTRSAGAHRAAMMNLGQQMQDATIQAQMGASALTIFTQQGSQAAYAMAGMGGKVGQVASIMAGPWGAAVFAGTALLGPFIAGLANAGSEAETSASKIDLMTEALDRLRAAQGRVTMQQLGYAQADVFEKEAKVRQFDRAIAGARGNVGLAAGVRKLELDREGAQNDLVAAQDLLKVSKMRAEVQARADAADKAATASERAAKEEERAAKAAERAARAEERRANSLKQFGAKAGETIQRTMEQFDRQPSAIDKAAQAIRGLDAIIADLGTRRPIGFAKMIEEATAAKDVAAASLLRPLEEMEQSSARRLEVQDLLARGRDDEAAALQNVWALEDKLGSEEELRAKVQALVTAGRKDEAAAFEQLLARYPDMKRQAADLAAIDAQRTREAEAQRALFEAQLDVINTARGSLTDLLSGRKTDLVGDIRQSLKDLTGARLSDQLFGGVFAELEDQLRQRTPLGKATSRLTDSVTTAGDNLDDLASAIEMATKRIGVTAPGVETDPSLVDGNPIRVLGQRGGEAGQGKPEVDISKMSVVDLSMKIAGAMVEPFQASLDKVLGTEFGQLLGSTITGSIGGNIAGGVAGGILGGLKGAVDHTGIFGGSAGKLSDKLGGALDGTATGSMTAGIMKSLGIKTSTTGAQIGGALGSFVPGGEIIGSIAGGILGGLLKKTKWGRVDLSASGASSAFGNSGKSKEGAVAAGDSFTDGLRDIIDQLGGTMGDFGSISLGVRHGDWRVNTGGTSLKTKNGAKEFNDDQEAAIKYAIMAAIDRGAVEGIKASTQRLLRAGDDLDAALQDALDWENVFRELKSYKDPMGAALDDLDTEFKRYIDLAKEAGASQQEMADLQELYGIKQAEAIEAARDRLLGPLQGLFDDLTVGDNGLSLRDRRSAAMDTYEDLAARVKAGDRTAYDDYADAAQKLLDIERSLYGSQQAYFDRLTEVTDLTKSRIDAETNVVSIAENRDNPFDSTGAVKSSIERQTDMQQSQLSAVNENLGRVLSALNQIAANGSAPTSASARITLASNF